MQIWNRQSAVQMVWLLKHVDPDAPERCQKIFKIIEPEFGGLVMQPTAFRGGIREDDSGNDTQACEARF